MATLQQRSWSVLQLVKKESVTAVQRAFRTQFHMELPSQVSIYAWYKKFEQKGCICKGTGSGRPCVCDATVDRVRKPKKQHAESVATTNNRLHQGLTPAWLFGTTWTRILTGDGSVVKEPMTSYRADGRLDRQTSLRVGVHKRQSVRPYPVSISAEVEAANHNCHSYFTRNTRHKVWDELDHRLWHLPCNSRSIYRVSVRCIQNFVLW
jgi:hypothetical protein